MPQTEAWTIGRLLSWTTKYLEQQGAESPRLDAEVLLAEARGCRRIELYTSFEEVAEEKVRTAFRELVRRRAEGMPVAYLVGRREFYSLSFRVTPDVLIPRPETELLVIRLLDLAKLASPGAELQIADVGTGSGIVAICAARHIPQAKVTALDLSPAALEVARLNAADHGVADRIEWLESDLFAGLPDERKFDFVVSNPPYVSSSEMEILPDTVRGFEPILALEAGPKGTAVIERLIPEAADRLRPGGWLLIEISPMLDTAVQALFAASGQFESVTTMKDLTGLPRVVQGKRRSAQ